VTVAIVSTDQFTFHDPCRQSWGSIETTEPFAPAPRSVLSYRDKLAGVDEEPWSVAATFPPRLPICGFRRLSVPALFNGPWRHDPYTCTRSRTVRYGPRGRGAVPVSS